MREILFRGKRLDNGEWVEGNFYESGISGAYILQNVTRKTVDARTGEITMRDEPVPFEIDPATVCQYTGLKDKNGKRIFEGDIVHCLARMDEANCVVIFEEGEFRLVPERTYKTYVTGGGYHALRCFLKEVIGNIHDNPEMLKGGEG